MAFKRNEKNYYKKILSSDWYFAESNHGDTTAIMELGEK